MYSPLNDDIKEVNTKSTYNDALPFLLECVNAVDFGNIFHYVGRKVAKCKDNKFRICKVFKFEFEYEGCRYSFSFLLDKSLDGLAVLNRKSQKQMLNN